MRRVLLFIALFACVLVPLGAHAEQQSLNEQDSDFSIMPISGDNLADISDAVMGRYNIRDAAYGVFNLAQAFSVSVNGQIFRLAAGANITQVLTSFYSAYATGVGAILDNMKSSSLAYYDGNQSGGTGTYNFPAGLNPSQSVAQAASIMTSWFRWQFNPKLQSMVTGIGNVVTGENTLHQDLLKIYDGVASFDSVDLSRPCYLKNYKLQVANIDYSQSEFYETDVDGVFYPATSKTFQLLQLALFSSGSNVYVPHVPVAGTIYCFSRGDNVFFSSHLKAFANMICRLPAPLTFEGGFGYSLLWVPDDVTESAFAPLEQSVGDKLDDAANGIADSDAAIANTESQFTNTATEAVGQLSFDSQFTNYADGLDFVGDTFMLIWNGSPVLSGIITMSLMLGVFLLLIGRGSRLFPRGGDD